MSEESRTRSEDHRAGKVLGAMAAVATIVGTIIALLQFLEPDEEAPPGGPQTSAQLPQTSAAPVSTAGPGDGQPPQPGGPAVDVEPDVVSSNDVFVVSGEGFDMLGVTLNWVMDTGETRTIAPFVAVADGRFRWTGLLPPGFDPCGRSGHIEAWDSIQVAALAAAPFSVEC
jgi:hypothetical protein